MKCQIKVEGTHLILEFVFIGHCLQYGQMIISCGIAARTKVVCQDVICAATKVPQTALNFSLYSIEAGHPGVSP